MAEKRVKVIAEFFQNDGNIYNKTERIPFSKGVLMPLGNSHRNKLKRTIEEEAYDENLSKKERQEIACFSDELSGSNKSEGTMPSFVILDNDGNIVGHICISYSSRIPRKRFHESSSASANQGRIRKKDFYSQANPIIEFDAEVMALPIRLLNAVIYKENIASIKTIQAVGNFEDMGCVKLVRNDNEIDECRIFTLEL